MVHVPPFIILQICFQTAHVVDDSMTKEHMMQSPAKILEHILAGHRYLLRVLGVFEVEVDFVGKVLLRWIRRQLFAFFPQFFG